MDVEHFEVANSPPSISTTDGNAVELPFVLEGLPESGVLRGLGLVKFPVSGWTAIGPVASIVEEASWFGTRV